MTPNQAWHRSRYSDARGPLGSGLPPIELWGVAQRDPSHFYNERRHRVEPRPEVARKARRGPAALERRRAKCAARAAGVSLRAWLRRPVPPTTKAVA
jgi:hypothetical protein